LIWWELSLFCVSGKSDTPREILNTPKVILVSPEEKIFIHLVF
jgi:hypothetical protein